MQEHLAHNKRPPIVVVMGHIDHGKSTLLDYIRKTSVTKGEAGAITQHLGAYEAEHTTSEGKKVTVTFIDTPGHEAFKTIRSRGAAVADIAILVVSAEDGVKKQTLEAFNAIKEAEIPYIVAINKIDKPNADVNRTKQSLAEAEIFVEGYGGDIPVVSISALTGEGIPALLDMINLVAELENLEADPEQLATGMIVEGRVDARKGICTTLIVQNGSLKKGMVVATKEAFAPLRALTLSNGTQAEEVFASTPILVSGWNTLPDVGETWRTFSSRKAAEAYVHEQKRATVFRAKVEEDPRPYVPIIIKADTVGSLDGLEHELSKLSREDVMIRIISKGIGAISDGDIKLAQSLINPVIIAFHIPQDIKTKVTLDRLHVTLMQSDIIYEFKEQLEAILEDRRPRKMVETELGELKILANFSRTRDRQIIGGKVQKGIVTVGADVKIMRRGAEIGKGKVRELQQQKARTQEVKEGFECGLQVETKYEIAIGDVLVAFDQKEV